MDHSANAPVTQPLNAPLPTPPGRVAAIDTLRGIAILGILPVNIWFFALNPAVMFAPNIGGSLTGADFWAWAGTHLLFEWKMISIFSMLFGASTVLMAESTERASPRPDAAAFRHYKRMAWLLAIGMLHAYFLWFGDILTFYALCGMILYPCRKLPPKVLIGVGFAMTLVVIPIFMGFGAIVTYAESQIAADPSQAGQWNEMLRQFKPSAEAIAEHRSRMVGPYWTWWRSHAIEQLLSQVFLFPMFALWKNLGLMLVGVGLVRLGFLRAQWSAKRYTIIALAGIGISVACTIIGIIDLRTHDFSASRNMLVSSQFNAFGSNFGAIGIAALVMLGAKLDVLSGIRSVLAAVGRMAFTNYLTQTLICTFIMNGWGLGKFGSFNRPELCLFVLAIWTLQILWSNLWLRFASIGPAEWVWRSLVELSPQPWRRTDTHPVLGP